MTAHAYFEEPHTEPQCNPQHAVRNALRVYKRLAWIISACISLLSARHLLVEQNLHYPLQLYFSQLIVTALIALRPYWIRHDNQGPFRERPKPRGSQARGTVLIATSTCLMWLSTICALQAILHFQNLPTLVMMTVRLSVSQIRQNHADTH
jgi:hypothetical protein